VFRPRGSLRGSGSNLETVRQNRGLDSRQSKNDLTGRASHLIGFLALLFFLWFGFGLHAALLMAQTAPAAAPTQGFGPAYDAAHEVTITGTIDQVVAQQAAGSPAGTHLLVAGPQGIVDAHVGPFLSAQTKSALQQGAPVEMVGAMLSLHGNDYLLVRQLTVGGRTVILRSPHGLLIHEHVPGEQRPERARRAEKPTSAGGGL
jgi:hypothetical protein